jgi:hypothetical protein
MFRRPLWLGDIGHAKPPEHTHFTYILQLYLLAHPNPAKDACTPRNLKRLAAPGEVRQKGVVSQASSILPELGPKSLPPQSIISASISPHPTATCVSTTLLTPQSQSRAQDLLRLSARLRVPSYQDVSTASGELFLAYTPNVAGSCLSDDCHPPVASLKVHHDSHY